MIGEPPTRANSWRSRNLERQFHHDRVNVPALRNVLALASLGMREWAIVAVLSIVPAAIGQGVKRLRADH